MLTPAMIEQFNKVSGGNVPLTGQPATTSRADEIRTLAKKSTPAPTFDQDNASIIQKHTDAANADLAGTSPESQGEGGLVRGLQSAAQRITTPVDLVGNLIKHAAGNNRFSEKTDDAPQLDKSGISNVADKVGFKAEPTPAFADAVNKFSEAHPEAAKHLDSLLKGLGATGEIAGTVAGADLGAAGAEKVGIQASKALEDTKLISTIGTDSNALANNAKDLANIKKTISPELTAKESKIAQAQGRVYEGKDPTLFKGETPDQVATSDATTRQVFTIHKNIPNAGSMNASELHDALGNKVNKITNTLRPKLDATPLHPDSFREINNDWQKIQKEQMANAPADQESNLLKRQKKFDAFLQKTKQGDPSDVIAEIRNTGSTLTDKEATDKIAEASKPPTLGDLWDTAIQYDKSIPDVVKSAKPPLASESLLQQREEWIQNREILKKAINNNTTGLGETSQKAFQEMSDMLDARSNIIKNTKSISSSTLKPSNIGQFIKNHPTVAKIGAGIAGGEAIRAIATGHL